MSIFTIDSQKCAADSICVAVCPLGLIALKDTNSVPEPIDVADEYCIRCGHCLAVCPHGALTLGDTPPEAQPLAQESLIPTPERVEHFLRYRRSCRNYKEEPVTRGILARLIDIARYAPSGHNSQPVHWLVIQDANEVHRLAGMVVDWMRGMIGSNPEVAGPMHFQEVVDAWAAGNDRVLRGAPHLIVAHGDKDFSPAQAACVIALTYLELAAPSFELGACWAGYFNACAASYDPRQTALALPHNHQSFGAMMVGYPTFPYQRLPERNEPAITWR